MGELSVLHACMPYRHTDRSGMHTQPTTHRERLSGGKEGSGHHISSPGGTSLKAAAACCFNFRTWPLLRLLILTASLRRFFSLGLLRSPPFFHPPTGSGAQHARHHCGGPLPLCASVRLRLLRPSPTKARPRERRAGEVCPSGPQEEGSGRARGTELETARREL